MIVKHKRIFDMLSDKKLKAFVPTVKPGEAKDIGYSNKEDKLYF
jgi:hypothetical protein